MKRLTLRTRARMAAAGTVTAAAALVALALPGSAAQAATSVGQATVELSSHSARATGVTYIVSFVATSGLAPGDTVTLTGPSGTTFPASGNNWGLYDDTASNQAGGLNFTSSGGTVTGTVGSIT